MALKKNFVIQVGLKRPAEIMTGTLDKRSGTPTGETGKVGVPVGIHLLLNYSEVWGQRVLPGSKVAEGVVSVTDKEYKGEIEFLPWGHKDGHRIAIRHLRSSPNSLDLQYQKEILKLVPQEDEGMIALHQGLNHYAYETDGVFIDFLKNHFRNEDCKTKSPDIIGFDFVEMTAEKEDKGVSKAIAAKGDAVIFITGYSAKPASLRLIAEVLALNSNPAELYNIDEYSSDLDVYTSLLKLADANAAVLLSGVDTFRKSVTAELAKANAFNKLDLSKEKVIAIINTDGKKEILLKDIPAKGVAMLTHVANNIFNEEVYEAYKRVASETANL